MVNKPSGYSDLTDNDEIDIGQVLARLWSGRFWIILVTGAAGVVGLINAMGTAYTYRADALMQLEEKTAQLALPAALTQLTNSDPRSVTEIEIIMSRLVLGQAVAESRADWRVSPRRLPKPLAALDELGLPFPSLTIFDPYVRKDEQLRLDLLEVPSNWLGLGIVLTVQNDGRFEVNLPDGSVREGTVDVTLTDSEIGFALRVGALEAAANRQFTISHLQENAAVRSLRGRLSVSERGRQSGILELSLTGQDMLNTQRTLDAIAQAYLRQNISSSAAEAESSLAFVEGQMPEAEARTRTAENALNLYRQQQQAIDLSFEGQNLLTQIRDLEIELQKIMAEEDVLSVRYTRNHPVYQQLMITKQRVELRLDRLRAEVANLPQTQREVLNLTRDLELAQAVYLELQNRAQELRVLRASSIGNARIVDQATIDERPIGPRRSRILAFYLLLGLVAGVGFVLIKNALRKGVQSADEIGRLGLPVYATLNLSKKVAGTTKRGSKLPILALSDPDDLTVEGFRSLRTSLHFAMLDAKSRTLTLTSAEPDVGKSFCSVNLAVVAAQAGQTVCVIDADLRRGVLRRYFNLTKSHLGLADYLSGKAALDDILVSGPIPGLFVIPTGAYPPNPSELLMRDRLKELVAELDSRFDLSIFDTPPALAVTDPVLISSATGAAIAVVRFDRTPADEISTLQLELEQGGAYLSGAVLNAFDPRRAKAGYGYGYGYTYRYQYPRDARGAKRE